MSDVIPERINLQEEETNYRGAVSEILLKRQAAATNFINYYQNKKMFFGFVKGISTTGSPTYNVFTAPLVISDFEEFEFNSEIVGLELSHNTSGSGGTTTLEIDWSSANSGSWSSIFSTPPSVSSVAPTDAQFDTFGNAVTPAGCTVPVLSKTTFNAGDRLRCRCTSLQTGFPNGFTIKLLYRPA